MSLKSFPYDILRKEGVKIYFLFFYFSPIHETCDVFALGIKIQNKLLDYLKFFQ